MVQRKAHGSHQRLRLGTRVGALSAVCLTIGMLLSGCLFTPNLPPTARIFANHVDGAPPLAVTFDGTSSSDEDGVIRAYQWTFGEGLPSQAMRPTHTYMQPGDYDIVLTVTDDDGASGFATITVTVIAPNASPVALFTATPTAALPQEKVQFDATGSLDGDGSINSYRWDFGDGTQATGAVVAHQFSEPGTYPVILSVTDDDGAVGTHQSDLLVIDTNQAPQPQIAVSSAVVEPGESLICSADGSFDPDGDIVSYEWDFGDGSRAEGKTAVHAYASNGTYRVTLTATDNLGSKQSTVELITVGAASPQPAPAPDPEDSTLCAFSWYYGGSRSLSLSIPNTLIDYYQDLSRDVWAEDGYSRFVLDPKDDTLMVALRDALIVNNSYQATIENALAFVQKSVTYQLDPAGSEYPRYPVETLVDRVGDCEDSAILYASIVRTFGYSAGVLLVTLDTDDDQVMDHVAVFVRVADCFVEAHPDRSLWTISGRTYALAETAISGGYLALGIDPWGIDQDNIHDIWDVGGTSQPLHATKYVAP